ncbi:MAG: ABC transporter ATP-binding protein [Eubacteriales bacterium]|nr:ABC transporter ATP-binding protein [Eubacteriales bacterium]
MKAWVIKLWTAQRYMLRFAWMHAPALFLLSLVEMLAVSVLAPVSVRLTQRIMQALETGAGFRAALACIAALVGWSVGVRLLIAVIQHFTYWKKVTLSEQLDLALFEKTCNMDLHILETPEMQTLYQQAGAAMNNNRSVKILSSVFTMVSAAVSVALTAAIMAGIEPWVLAVFGLTIAVKTVSVIRTKRQQFKNWKLDAELQKEFNYHINLLFDDACAQEMRMTGLSSWLAGKYRKVARRARDIEMSSTNEITVNRVVDTVMSCAQQGVLYAFLAWKVLFRGLLLSEFTVFLTGIQSVTDAVGDFIEGLLDTGENAVYLDSYIAYMNVKNTIAVDKPGSIPLDRETMRQSPISLRDVRFRYPGADSDALTDVNLDLEPGKLYMIVGENGAGKTTLAKLLCRLFDPSQGSIRIGDRDIRDISYRDWRGGIGIVFQDYKVYEYPIGENVALDQWSDENPPEGRVWEVLRKVRLDKKVESLTKKLDTPLGRSFSPDGIRLSGGETQKIAMAKALFKERAILILDEPSSALDAIAENELVDSLFQAAEGRTVFYISHRLSAARRADRILFMKDRTVEAVGTHNELMQTCPDYATLYSAQADNYK